MEESYPRLKIRGIEFKHRCNVRDFFAASNSSLLLLLLLLLIVVVVICRCLFVCLFVCWFVFLLVGWFVCWLVCLLVLSCFCFVFFSFVLLFTLPISKVGKNPAGSTGFVIKISTRWAPYQL